MNMSFVLPHLGFQGRRSILALGPAPSNTLLLGPLPQARKRQRQASSTPGPASLYKASTTWRPSGFLCPYRSKGSWGLQPRT